MKRLEAFFNNLKFLIEEEEKEVGAYLYVLSDERSIADYLQGDIESCKDFALEEYGVPKNIWKELKNGYSK